MYLSQKQEAALAVALEALEYGLVNSFGDDGLETAYDEIRQMLERAKVSKQRRKLQRKARKQNRARRTPDGPA